MKVLLDAPDKPRAGYVLAHGAGAGMNHPFMKAIAAGLAARGVAVVRYQFPYMDAGSKRPDPPKVAHAAVREAVAEAARELPGLPLFAGGKSFGGRMTSQAQAEAPLEGVRGLVFLGFPLHAPGKPGIERAAHLQKVTVPMLFLQGTRDEFADYALLQEVIEGLRGRARLESIEDANHSFRVPARTGLEEADVMAALLDRAAAFIEERR